MSKRLVVVVGAGLAAILLGAVFAIPILAQDPELTPAPKLPFGWGGRGFSLGGGCLGFGGRVGSWAAYDTVAEALGLTPEELFSQLHAGQTLADIAEAQGVDLADIRSRLQATHTERLKEAIEQAVTDGRLTREQADWMLQGVELGFMPGRGGLRWGHGMRGRVGGTTPSMAFPGRSSLDTV